LYRGLLPLPAQRRLYQDAEKLLLAAWESI